MMSTSLPLIPLEGQPLEPEELLDELELEEEELLDEDELLEELFELEELELLPVPLQDPRFVHEASLPGTVLVYQFA